MNPESQMAKSVNEHEIATSRGKQRDLRRGAFAGALAAVAMLVVIVVARATTGVISLLDVLADALLLALPVGLFAALLDAFGSHAKTLLLGGLLVAILLLGAALGRLFAAQTAGSRSVKWGRAGGYGAAIFAGSAILLVLIAGRRMPDQIAGLRVFAALAALALAAAAFGLTLAWVLALLRRQDPPPDAAPAAEPAEDAARLNRRVWLTRAGLGVATLAGLGVLGREVARVARRPSVGGGATGELSAPITPVEDFYVVSKNFSDPDGVDDGWSLRVDGLVERPLDLGQADLEALAGEEFVSTLNCISNPIGGPLIGTARWTGVPLSRVLDQAGIAAGVVDGIADVVCHGRDGYTDSIPLEKALAPETHVVWAMNGAPLNDAHGTPLRIIVPGLYGIKNVKWLDRIELTNQDYRGYWQDRGWTETAEVKTLARIDQPGESQILDAGPTEIAGVAFAGVRGIRAVEISTDDGATWQPAQIIANPSEPAGTTHSWVLWRLPWTPDAGAYTLAVRATDGAGAVQPEEETATLPDGATGWHRVTVGVA